ncbi:octanoyl-[acyl-carrier-protein]:protein N-octanoyltransferase LIPT2, mitochondrial [Ambystoma mexicanum]|uniref:octanoyl-[acyl-carrier-protein]:protein N-octanoyltransferase LIPT2, mitochondrial n=1 Tax=Ambystoma mexicanum TaxID=8296 RepID=UPI0037E76B23
MPGLERPAVRVLRLGLRSYEQALAAQAHCVEKHREPGPPADTLLLCQHPPVYTVGLRRAPYPASEEERLRALGADFYRTDRGGLLTFHGPGQLVCYPVLDLRRFRRGGGLRWYVSQLEGTAISLCRRLGIEAQRSPHTGVWVRDNKICAIGIHCGRYITSHGLALNCNTDLTWFEHIVPCGIIGKGVTSLSRELDRDITVEETTLPFMESFQEHFNCTLTFEDESGP